MTPTNDAALRAAVLEALLEVAPDIDANALDAQRALREQFDFDSMDQLNFALALHARFGVDVPETDYPRLATLDGSVAYVADALNRRGQK
jgi:acyl carrier protein